MLIYANLQILNDILITLQQNYKQFSRLNDKKTGDPTEPPVIYHHRNYYSFKKSQTSL